MPDSVKRCRMQEFVVLNTAKRATARSRFPHKKSLIGAAIAAAVSPFNARGVVANPDFVMVRPTGTKGEIIITVRAHRLGIGQWIAATTWESQSGHLPFDGTFPHQHSKVFHSRSDTTLLVLAVVIADKAVGFLNQRIDAASQTNDRLAGIDTGVGEDAKRTAQAIQGLADCLNQRETLHRLDQRLTCTACQAPMVERNSQYGLFFGCSNYPICEATSRPCIACGRGFLVRYGVHICCDNPRCNKEYEACPECEDGMLVRREGKYGAFLGCTNYASGQCSYTRNIR